MPLTATPQVWCQKLLAGSSLHWMWVCMFLWGNLEACGTFLVCIEHTFKRIFHDRWWSYYCNLRWIIRKILNQREVGGTGNILWCRGWKFLWPRKTKASGRLLRMSHIIFVSCCVFWHKPLEKKYLRTLSEGSFLLSIQPRFACMYSTTWWDGCSRSSSVASGFV